MIDIPRLLSPGETPKIMGVLNLTPDSFSDGRDFCDADRALDHARIMIDAGADIIDVGAESTRPGATAISIEQEWQRLEPVFDRLVDLGCAISIDTYKAEIAARALKAGAVIVNDIWGLTGDVAMAGTVAEHGAGIVIMHNRWTPCADTELLDDIDRHFESGMAAATQAGIPDTHQMLDPGIGFAKTVDQNYQILKRLDRFKRHNRPILVGASRKRLIGEVIDRPADERDTASLVVHTMAMMGGATMIRTHEISHHRDAARIIAKFKAATADRV